LQNDTEIVFFKVAFSLYTVRAKAGEVYAFATLSEVTVKKHLRADGYMWVNKRTQFSPNGAIAKTYFYARLDFANITRDALLFRHSDVKSMSNVICHLLLLNVLFIKDYE
jgi:hypothetical protein